MKKAKHLVILMNIISLALIANINASASLSDSTLVTGTKELIQDATNALMIISPILGVLLIIYFLIRKSASDEVDQKKWKTAIMVTLICMIGVVVAAAVINIIIGYYQ